MKCADNRKTHGKVKHCLNTILAQIHYKAHILTSL